MKISLNKYYCVKKDDNLIKICNKFNLNKNILIKNNYIINENIEYGDILVIEEKSYIYHIVSPIDTLESIANKYNISINRILEINNIKNIFIGQKIKIK